MKTIAVVIIAIPILTAALFGVEWAAGGFKPKPQARNITNTITNPKPIRLPTNELKTAEEVELQCALWAVDRLDLFRMEPLPQDPEAKVRVEKRNQETIYWLAQYQATLKKAGRLTESQMITDKLTLWSKKMAEGHK